MADHQIRIGASFVGRIILWCSCTPTMPILHVEVGVVLSLDGLNVLAHEHIEGTPAYGVESAVTSEDDLIDLAAEGRSGAIGLG